MVRVSASSRGQISSCCNGFFYVATYDFECCNVIFLGCCKRCFCDVVVVLLEMLQYVSVASISCCSSCSMLLQVFLFRALFHMLHTSVAIICSKCFSSFNLLLQQFVPCCCNNMFMVFQLLQPNVAAVVPCCCNNMFMVFQLFSA